MLQAGVVRMEVGERLEHVYLPEAEALRKVAVAPVLRRPHVGHRYLALPQLVVVVQEVLSEPPARGESAFGQQGSDFGQ